MSLAGLSARGARTMRAAQAWADGNDAHGAPLEVLAEACIARATRLVRDLTHEEIAETCEETARAWAHEQEQRAAEEARQSAAEESRLRYLRERAAMYRLTGGDPTPMRRQARGRQG